MSQILGEDRFPKEFAPHKKYSCSPHLLNLVWTHCLIIADIAAAHLKEYNPDNLYIPLVVESCLLHEVGIYQCGGFDWIPGQPAFDRPYSHHTIVGAWILYKENYPPEVVQSALLHAGVGLTTEQITTFGLQLPLAGYTPTTPFQEFFIYIAKFHSKSPTFKTLEDIKNSLKKYGSDAPEKYQLLADKYGVPDTSNLETEYKEWHNGIKAMISNLSSPTQGSVHLPFVQTN